MRFGKVLQFDHKFHPTFHWKQPMLIHLMALQLLILNDAHDQYQQYAFGLLRFPAKNSATVCNGFCVADKPIRTGWFVT